VGPRVVGQENDPYSEHSAPFVLDDFRSLCSVSQSTPDIMVQGAMNSVNKSPLRSQNT
jgi:hypothetical protein